MKKSQLEMIKNKKYVKNAQKMKMKIVFYHIKAADPAIWMPGNR